MAEFYSVKAEFSIWDYVVFSLMMAISVCIGIFYGCTGGKQKTTKEFLLADRNMSPFPVAMSLVASFISAITVLGTPAEVYINGSMFWLFGIAYILAGFTVSRLFLPVFYRLEVTSANEYLEKRFNKVVRVAGTITFFMQMIFYLGIVIYAPALAFNAVTQLNLWGSVIAIGVVCTFYTTIGGMKAVLWTDVFQMCVMIAGFLAIIIEGSRRLGGIQVVWEIAEEGGRIDFWNLTPDPTIRHTFWSICIGGWFTWTATYGVNQSQVQRYLTIGSMKKAKTALHLAIAGLVIVVSLACSCGIVMYSFYKEKGCDPKTSKQIERGDQLIPFFVIELFGSLPGLPGLLISAVFSAALSTVSSGLNALAAVTAEDLVKPCFPKMGEERYTLVTKGLALFFGAVCILVAFLVSILNSGILQLCISLFGITGGPLLGVFSLGLFFPWANSAGALIGLISGLGFAFWVAIGSQFYFSPFYMPPLDTDMCYIYNITGFEPSVNDESIYNSTDVVTTFSPDESSPPIAELYSLSYAWYTCAFWVVTVVVGLLVSLLTGPQKPSKIEPILKQHIADGCYCCLPEPVKRCMRCGEGKLKYEEDRTCLADSYFVKTADGEEATERTKRSNVYTMAYKPNSDNHDIDDKHGYDNICTTKE